MDCTKPAILFLISSGFAPTILSASAPSFISTKVGMAFTSILAATS
ncbi:hypothetical protein OIU76_029092 [Salix suchowensis]|nr:hypothetical protein OIU76_029092 [Salix suchowensis]KAJ6367604.1 hypothetical protein OIU78_000215 [Salix suchowensis]